MSPPRDPRSRSRQLGRTTHWRTAGAVVAAVLFSAPLAVAAWGSTSAGAVAVLGAPGTGVGSAYREVTALLPIDAWVVNSALVVVAAVPVTVVVASAAAWAVRLSSRRVRRLALAGLVVVMLVPPSGTWATRFELWRWARLADTVVPVLAPAMMGTSVFFVLVYAWVFLGIEDEVLDAAVVDGAGPIASWWRVGLPQARGATFAVVALATAWHWGNLMDPLLHLRDPATFTVPLGLRLLTQLAPTEWSLLLAGAVMVSVVPLAVFVVAQRGFLGDHHLEGQ